MTVPVADTYVSPVGSVSRTVMARRGIWSAAAGWRLNGASSDPSVTVPSSITVPGSSVTFQFALGTTTVTAATTVSVELFDAPSGLPLWGQILTVTP